VTRGCCCVLYFCLCCFEGGHGTAPRKPGLPIPAIHRWGCNNFLDSYWYNFVFNVGDATTFSTRTKVMMIMQDSIDSPIHSSGAVVFTGSVQTGGVTRSVRKNQPAIHHWLVNFVWLDLHQFRGLSAQQRSAALLHPAHSAVMQVVHSFLLLLHSLHHPF